MKIGIGNDHAAVVMKNEIAAYLEELGYEVVDFGTDSETSCCYAEYGEKVARAVAAKDVDLGILICGTGVGISLAANKVKGIRCALCGDALSAEMTRRHNDANMLAMGAGIVGPMTAERIVDTFLSTGFEGGRHERRVKRMMEIEG